MVPVLLVKLNRAQELCESRGGRPGPRVPNSPYGFCGRKATLNLNLTDKVGAEELCESRRGRHGFSVPNSPHGLFGRKAKLNLSWLNQSWLDSHSENIRAQRYGVILVIGGRRFDSPLRLSFLFKGFGLWALSRDVAPQQLMKHQTALVALHLKAEIILVMEV